VADPVFTDLLFKIIPEPRTLADWENRELAEEVDTGFSSFAYYIGLYRTFDFCLYGQARDNEEAVKRVCTCADAGVISFRSFCSTTKRGLMGEDGKLDYFIFKANMVRSTTVCLFKGSSSLLAGYWRVSLAAL
jgi:hypothetical protein